MSISPEWVSAAIAGMAACGGMGAWLQRKATESRAALPNLRWSYGTLSVQNRLDEDIAITRIESDGLIGANKGAHSDDGKWVPAAPDSRRVDMEWVIIAGQSVSYDLLCGEGATFARLTISSSAKTLRNRRVLVRHSKAL